MLVSTDVSDLSVKITENIKKTEVYKSVTVEEYKLTGLSGDGICKNTTSLDFF